VGRAAASEKIACLQAQSLSKALAQAEWIEHLKRVSRYLLNEACKRWPLASAMPQAPSASSESTSWAPAREDMGCGASCSWSRRAASPSGATRAYQTATWSPALVPGAGLGLTRGRPQRVLRADPAPIAADALGDETRTKCGEVSIRRNRWRPRLTAGARSF